MLCLFLKNYFLKCIGNKDADEKVEKLDSNDLGDKIYILQDSLIRI